MRLAEQWTDILAALPAGWGTASIALVLEDEAQAARAGQLLGPAAPGRSHAAFRIDVARDSRAIAPSPALVRRVVERLDREGIRGRLQLVERPEVDDRPAGAATDGATAGLAAQWRALVGALPPGWSHLLVQVDLDSSDFFERGALLLAPANPTAAGGPRSLRFRCASAIGYGIAVGMAGRCLERLDGGGISGHVSIVHAVSDARPFATQGPVFRLGGRPV